MNLRSVDLNLLVVLHALIEEEHVSRASRRLHLSQPATSAALARLRQLFNDPLLERCDGGMRTTPLAERLRLPLGELLGQAETLLDRAPPPLSSIRQSVRLTSSDHVVAWLAGTLPARVAAQAPGIDLVFCPYHGPDSVPEVLARGEVDLAISIARSEGKPFSSRRVATRRWQVLMRRDHPAAEALTLDSWLAYPHVVVSGSGQQRVGLDDRLEAIGRSRRVGVTVPSFLLVPHVVRHGDLIATVPGAAMPGDDEGLVYLVPPVALDDIALDVIWHERRDADHAVQHVRHCLEALPW